MKKFLTRMLIAGLTVLFFIAGSACAPENGSHAGNGSASGSAGRNVTVLLAQNEQAFEIIGENPVTVESGGEARFVLSMREEYCADCVLRKGERLDAEIVNGSDGTTTVILKDVRFSITVQVSCIRAQARVAYYPNGGEYIDGGDSALPYTVGHALKSRLRPNTEIGTDRIRREGYVLNGWNTEADGSGEHIGLGSRVTMRQGRDLALYAEWEKVTNEGQFRYRKEGSGVAITRYLGNDKKVTVPELIEGMPVIWIDSLAFDGENENVETVILPPTVKGVSERAFYRSKVREIYFYDNLSSISDESFTECENFSTVHINAIEPPRYGKYNLYSEINLADKYDILILNADRKKLLVFGGSGAYISMDTKQMEQSLNGEYVCINMAVNGWFNGAAQMDMMLNYLREGDIFLHAPESASPYSFMYNLTMTPQEENFDYNRYRLYYCMESNYDLLSLVDVRRVEDLLDGFAGFNRERAGKKATSYTDYKTEVNLYGTVYKNDLGYIDDRGNFALPQEPRGALLDAGEADIVVEFVTDPVVLSRVNGYYDKMAEMGVKVFFSTAPVNGDTLLRRLENPDGLPDDLEYLYPGRPSGIPPVAFDNLGDWVRAFEQGVRDNLHATVLLDLSECVYRTEDFFDSDYHLSDEKTVVYTQKTIDALKKFIH